MNSLSVLKLICLLVFLGYMLIWTMLPTEYYKYEWAPKISEKFNATYIGGQGTNMFLLAFPMMLISVLGCIYIHIKNRKELSSETSSTSKKHHLALFKRPLLVLGPLGVITPKELIFVIMGITLMCWHFGNYFFVSVKHPYMGGHSTDYLWQKRFRGVSLRLGYASNVAWAFLFFPVTRLSSILPLVGLTYESSIKYHIWVGQAVMVLSALHSVGFVIYWIMTNQAILLLEWSPAWVSNVSGEISWIFLLAIWATSFAYTRRKSFELFFYTHQLYAVATFFYVVHIGVSWTCQILPGIFLFVLDRYLRFLQSRSNARLISARLLPGGNVEMTFHKSPGVHYGVTSTLFVNVPKISRLQWHPFTVISNENMDPDTLSIAFNSGGTWTTKIHKELSSSLDRLEVSVEGPYEPASTSLLEHESLVLISGGTGVTPYISIIREIIHRSNTQKGHVPRVQLICAFKHASDLTMLDLLLPVDGTTSDLSKIQLEIQVYITRENEPPIVDSQKLVQTKWFKPSPEDAPITPVLGQNGWLLLSFIITSSFILFFIILALVTQYHIYPIDHNTNEIYNFTFWGLWDIFIMCVSIIFISSIVFLWQKSKMADDRKQIKNVEVPSPLSSPGSWFGEILSECKGSDVGVIASGPRGMRHDVARICSFFGSKNLHYEYLSFTWQNSEAVGRNFGISQNCTNLFLRTFPMILISVLGGIYIHIKNRKELSETSSTTTSKKHLAFLRRPLLVLRPLGVVNTRELTFAFLGIALIVWQFGNYFFVSIKHPYIGGHVTDQLWQKRFQSVTLRIGYASNVAWAFLFFPVTRLSSILPLILPGIFLFTLDRYLRFLQSRSHARLISARLLPGGTVEMTFQKSPGVHYGVTSTLFVNAPNISKLQWHPFTVISNENMEPDTLSIAFNSGGTWTTKIYKELSSSLDRLEVSVEGPYEPASTSFLEHESLVLISGGSGITPYISIIREIVHRSNIQKGHVPRVQLICAFRHASDLTMLDLLLPVNGTTSDLSKIQLEIQVYITRENKPPTADSQKLVQTKWFNPSPRDVPITPVLGQNGWLFLSIIIASSFILFFILLALVTQYHIYPIDHNTNERYNFTIRVLWDIFIMCASIIFVSSIIYLWQKSKMTDDREQIKNVEVPSPMSTPGSWFGGGSSELESLSYQSLVQATQLHYEGRPNIQKILSGCKGSDIGVMASGPREMRHDVARICSCFGSKNLHYEYLSFTW
ncbi:hypothetical protein KSS87_020456 [Heliosperma pusillum]|nr:hypothetical protein KSS87_020456 [Heliosperma pusillum]